MHDDEFYGSVEGAIYDTVNGYVEPSTRRKGAVALAPQVGMLPATLSNKANPLQEHQLTLRESIPLQLVARNFNILNAYAQALGHVAYQLPESPHVSDMELLNQYAEMHAAMGVMAKAVRDSLADGNVTNDEVHQIRDAFDDTARAGLGLLVRLEALADVRR